MAGLVHMGEMGAIALHVMAELVGLNETDPDARLTGMELATRLHASVHTVQKVIRRLTLAGLLEGTRGANGGVRLADATKRVSLLEVLEGTEGPARTNGCLFAKRVCPTGAPCRFQSLTAGLEEHILTYLRKTTVTDIVNEEREIKDIC